MKERLQKIIAAAGIDSRRHAEILITSGRVSVNGEIVTELGVKADPRKDVIRVDGNTISLETTRCYIALHKPAEYVTTMSDPQKRPTVADLVKDVPERVYPIGRLDYDSSGLLLLTNDGDFAQKIQHPRFQVPKNYRVKISGRLNKEELKQIINGVKLPDTVFKPENLNIEKINDKSTWLSLTLREGKNRIIRRGFEAAGRQVTRLVRESIGKITLAGLKEGQWRNLTGREISQLLNDSNGQKR
ncbi:MAG: pseudouridine synthase [Deltaproteobacteria bacterium HGW-Deltaproteobacteria-9]|jgi:23S rRNA pseudouridine2605 synthase|nr:MAG: pseudouridine synthase [Deltaproteobacteria bacterium HGW-Deltaproteobacteria-9]